MIFSLKIIYNHHIRYLFLSYFALKLPKFGIFIKLMSWIFGMLITWQIIHPPPANWFLSSYCIQIFQYIGSLYKSNLSSNILPSCYLHVTKCLQSNDFRVIALWKHNVEIICLHQRYIVLVKQGWHFPLLQVLACISFLLL